MICSEEQDCVIYAMLTDRCIQCGQEKTMRTSRFEATNEQVWSETLSLAALGQTDQHLSTDEGLSETI